MSDPRELAAKVREEADQMSAKYPDHAHQYAHKAALAAALDALVAECEDAQQREHECGRMLAKVEADREEMRRERDEAMDEWPKVAEGLQRRAEAAERERDEEIKRATENGRLAQANWDRARRYEEALKRIELVGSSGDPEAFGLSEIACAALAEDPTAGWTPQETC